MTNHYTPPADDGISNALSDYAANLRFEDLPSAVVETSKKSMLDAIGVTLGAGTLGEGCRAFIDLARESCGTPESTVIGFDFRTSAVMAALANGSMAHALDFEDGHAFAFAHPNAATIPAALAVAEAHGGIGGKELLTALALGSDIVCRMGLAFTVNTDDFGWYTPPILNAYGATAAAGHLLKLGTEEMLDAFSLALCQATLSGELKANPQSHVRSIRDGFMAQAGVLAAMLAQKGVKGFDRPFEGKAGFFALFARGHYDPTILTKGLRTEFEGANLSYKPWPSCRGTHSFVEAALHIAKAAALTARDIASIDVVVSRVFAMLCEPADQKRAPQTAIGAKFSIPFTVATALVRGNLRLADFESGALTDERVIALAQRVRHVVDDSLSLREGRKGTVRITTVDGRVHEKTIAYPLGHPENPISNDVLIAKFMDCATFAPRLYTRDRCQKIVDLVFDLERLADISELTQLL